MASDSYERTVKYEDASLRDSERKRKKIVIDDDDDFECAFVLKNNREGHKTDALRGKNVIGVGKGKENRGIDGEDKILYPKLMCRCCPNVLLSTMKVLNDVQKNAVRELGFGHILDLKVREVPSRLSYWLLDNFDPISCEIQLQRDRLLIEAEDVHRVFGFPRGNRQIVKKDRHESYELLDEWRNFFPKRIGTVGPGLLSDVIIDLKEAGDWFKRHFMILLTACLMENSANGYINPQIMRCFEDVSSVDQWDWCEFVVNCLVQHAITWKKSKKNPYFGPHLFITVRLF